MKIPEKWTFKNSEVAENFDSHVNEQLPWYDLATKSVGFICENYIPEGGLVYDIGASTGNIGRTLAPTLKERNAKLIAIEESKEMAEGYSGGGKLVISKAEEFNFEEFDVAILFLVLMFCNTTEREFLIHRLKSRLRKGGAIIVFDKINGSAGYFDTVMKRLTLRWKLENGAKPEDILIKELSLSGVQRPIDEHLLGKDAKKFFAFGEFGGWIIEG